MYLTIHSHSNTLYNYEDIFTTKYNNIIKKNYIIFKSPLRELNSGPPVYKTGALPLS